MTAVITKRFSRQEALVPTDIVKSTSVTVIGVGAIGRQLALQLASLGVGQLQLIDPDTVETTNVTTQGYSQADIGRTKVKATGDEVLGIDPSLVVDRVEGKYRSTLKTGGVVFCCVDAIATRAALWRSLGNASEFWCDGRMRGEVLRVLTAVDPRGRQKYQDSLFPQREAQAGPCTARGVIYTAAIAAGLMTAQFAKWRRGVRPDLEVSLNLLAGEMVVDW